MNKVLTIMLMIIGAGLAFAIAPAEEWEVGAQSHYVPTGFANVTTEGGNVTPLNLTSNVSTIKWAGFWGDVSGQLVLSDSDSNFFFTWAWDATDGGKVCAVAASTGFDWTSVQTASAATIDTVYGFTGTDTDSATNTLISSCNITVAGTAVTGSVGNDTLGGFTTCAVADGDDTVKEDFAFCTEIDGGATLFNTLTGDYELMVPTEVATTETYFFWLELD